MTSGPGLAIMISPYDLSFLRWRRVLAMCTCAWILWSWPSVAGAKEVFKDEAGRVIYTIDDEGLVSMFENSSNDMTLSVTRGTKEKMQPQVSEVTPRSVTAGTYVVLQIRGKNLVGAKVAMSVPQLQVGEYFGRPQSLEIPLQIPPTVPAGDVTIVVMTPIGRAQTHFFVTEVRQTPIVQTPTQRNGDGTKEVSTEAPKSCPEGMIGIAAERGGFCIDLDETFSGDLGKAEKSCAMAGKRLCDAIEWHQACEDAQKGTGMLKNMTGNWEWTSSIGSTRPLTSILVGQPDCKAERMYQPWKNETISGRCCK